MVTTAGLTALTMSTTFAWPAAGAIAAGAWVPFATTGVIAAAGAEAAGPPPAALTATYVPPEARMAAAKTAATVKPGPAATAAAAAAGAWATGATGVTGGTKVSDVHTGRSFRWGGVIGDAVIGSPAPGCPPWAVGGVRGSVIEGSFRPGRIVTCERLESGPSEPMVGGAGVRTGEEPVKTPLPCESLSTS